MEPSKPPILLIHGLWVTAKYWEYWIPYFELLGYEVHAPEWPGINGRSPEEVRADPRSLANRDIEEIVNYYEAFINKLLSPPIIIGHSFGGLFVQILLSRGLGAAGVAICPAQPAGIITLPLNTLKAAFPILKHGYNKEKTIPISEHHFHWCFANNTRSDESREYWKRYSIPGVARVLWQLTVHVAGGHSAPTYVDFKKADRAPLLLLSASKDHVVPASTVRKNFEAYDNEASAVVEYKMFPGRSHGMIFQPGWEELADYVLDFIARSLR
ncbi:arylesterase-like protein [Colletotrichum truncatum]|uniref:Arylesterase-like protein n=1 Tax=Colletotrichum truncatum TaxID=5467 RepID=A0ACC3YSI3_COLTU|nr:arylesterase-like protein [Colletotrichum truncatum]KAF6789743.1 arylesterase-like protein [Colletotrichum truncatum]